MESQLENLNKLEQINKEAAEKASAALSKLIDRSVEIGISKAQVKKVEELSPLIGNEEVVAGIYLPVTGEINGAALLIFPRETAFILSDLLVKRPPGTTRKLTKLDESALKEVGNIILYHHERFDGKGYPQGLKNKEIPGEARIFALADALDAITSHRPYRKERDFKSAKKEIQANAGTQFDSEVVEAFSSIPLENWERIRFETTQLLPNYEKINSSILRS